MTNHIIVTRPGFPIDVTHVSEKVQDRIVDLRGTDPPYEVPGSTLQIYITDAVNMQISATDIRRNIREQKPGWNEELSEQVAKYIEKYQIYR
jgi:nicotinic acid mononucleotide adenylyltransferase